MNKEIVIAAFGWLLKLPGYAVTAIVDAIVAAMTGNENFTTPLPALVDVKAANEAAKTAIANAVQGGRMLIAIKNAKLAELAALVRPLASYVTVTAAGDMVKLLSSGFPIQKPTRQPIGALSTPIAPVVSPGDLFGSLNASTRAIYGAYVYNWRVATAAAPTVFVLQAQSTAASTQLSGLTRGEIYLVQVNAVGAAGATEWSDAANVTAP